jgi:hypothetical protein
VKLRAGTRLTAVPDRRRRPSDGLVVEASIVARLFGLRLLDLDATVVVTPAEVRGPPPASRDARPRVRARGLGGPPAPDMSGAVPGRLAEAVWRIDEGAAILAESRRARASLDGGARR